MDDSLQQPELQLRTLRLYGELLCRHENWSGRLVLAGFPGASRSGFAAAASLVGAVSLVIDSDSASMKEHFREGAFDFVVNTLDEALRTIKNEIRRGNPLAIGLLSEPAAVLAEAAERGIAAALILCDSAQQSDTVRALSEPSGDLIDFSEPPKSSAKLQQWLADREWSPVELAAKETEKSLLEVLPSDDVIRRKWLRDLSTNQRSARRSNRWIWLSPKEKHTTQ